MFVDSETLACEQALHLGDRELFEFTLKPYKRYIAIKEKQKDYVLVSFKVTLLLGVYA